MTDKELKIKRIIAIRNLLKLKKIVNSIEDEELIDFIQEIVDSYMMHECKLGRLKN